jgi:GNAT superfamily N-acetyltransferase
MLSTRYSITRARPHDIPHLAAIERAAADLLKGNAPDSVLQETTGDEEVNAAQGEERLWVALADDTPVAFALVEMLGNGVPHLEEIDVDPRHGRRGLGTALVRAVCAWAARAGHAQVTLTTFRDLPFNMPFYARLGFEVVPNTEWSSEVAAVVRDETQRGLDPTRRVVMRYRTGGARPPS